MAKTVTSPEQGNVLITLDISPESADFFWSKQWLTTEPSPDEPKLSIVEREDYSLYTINNPFYRIDAYAWSLAALMKMLRMPPYTSLDQDNTGWYCMACRMTDGKFEEITTCLHEEPLDACVEMIKIFKEKGLL